MLWFFQWSCMDVRVCLWRKLSAEELMLLNCGVGEDSWESLGLQEDPTSPKTEEELSCWSLLTLLSPCIALLLPHFPITHQEHLGWCSKKVWNKQASFLEISFLPSSAHFHLLILFIGLLAYQVLQLLQIHSGISFVLFPILVVQGPSSYT